MLSGAKVLKTSPSMLAYGKQYYEENKEKIAAYGKQYREENKDKWKTYAKNRKEKLANGGDQSRD